MKMNNINLVELEHVDFSYTTKGGERKILEDFSLAFNQGTITCIMGPSGCGKSTLLDIIGRFKEITGGTIKYASDFDKKSEIGIIFQKNILLPWKTVFGNLELPLKVKSVEKAERQRIIHSSLDAFNMLGIEDYYPEQLSGGMYARIALLRIMILEPKLILADEAFSALDYATKESVLKLFVNEIRKEKKTAIVITHDIEEALSIGDRLVLVTGNPLRIVYDVNIESVDAVKKEKIKNKCKRCLALFN